MNAPAISSRPTRLAKRFRVWSRRVSLPRKLALVLIIAAVISGIATAATMTGSVAAGIEPRTLIFLLYLDAVLVLSLGGVIAWRLAGLWIERRRGLAGAGLHTRLSLLFGLVAVTPAIIVVVFAGLFLNFGVHAWFSEQVSTALDRSNSVAQAYLQEHKQGILAETYAMANDINRQAPDFLRDTVRFNQMISAQAAFRNLPEALVVDGEGRVLARSRLSLWLGMDPKLKRAIQRADDGDIVLLTAEQDDRVRAVAKLNRFVDAYLIVGRFVDPKVVNHIQDVEQAVSRYQSLEQRRKSIQITFVLIFTVVALLLLLASAWIGLNVADRLARPISNLIAAAERVRKGDLDARVPGAASADELGTLIRAFNRMTGQLESQRRGLVDANRELDERRRFTETVLTGVSAGVIGLDAEARITLPNRSASELLSTDLESAIGRDFREVVPEMAPLLEDSKRRPERLHETQIRLLQSGNPRTLLVRVAADRLKGAEIAGFVVTFDDVTELLSAQRMAAWADIARRIAHEIKNPLTPIQLSAERLKRKYLKEVKSDPETFKSCAETIIRQVEDIGRMVDDFSSFARMPQPTMRRENLSEICRQTVFQERTRHDAIDFHLDLPDTDVPLRCDARQIGRALTNLLKNAAESVLTRAENGAAADGNWVKLSIAEGGRESRQVTIVIEDNGLGLPAEFRDRLTEPYVTTRVKGTGLGLAIVKKIMEDHNGDLLLEDRDEGGAFIRLVFHDADGDGASVGEDKAVNGSMNATNGILAHGS